MYIIGRFKTNVVLSNWQTNIHKEPLLLKLIHALTIIGGYMVTRNLEAKCSQIEPEKGLFMSFLN